MSEEAAAVPVAPAEKRRKTRAFRPDWKEKFPWVRCDIVEDEERLFCAQCKKSGRKNGFTRGSANMRFSSLTEHSQCNDHISAANLKQKIGASDFIGIIIDETVNITVDKKLILYVELEWKSGDVLCGKLRRTLRDGTVYF